MEIGLKLPLSLISPDLCIGINFAFFHKAGKIPVLMLKLHMVVTVLEIMLAGNFGKWAGRPSIPVALEGFSCFRESETSSIVIGVILNLVCLTDNEKAD